MQKIILALEICSLCLFGVNMFASISCTGANLVDGELKDQSFLVSVHKRFKSTFSQHQTLMASKTVINALESTA